MAFSISYTYQIIDKYTAQLNKITTATRQYTTAARKASSAAKTLQTSLTGLNRKTSGMSRSFATASTRTSRLATNMRQLKNTSAAVGANMQNASLGAQSFGKSISGAKGAPAVKGFSSRLRNASRDLLGFRGILFSMFVGAGAKKMLNTFVGFETTMNMFSAASLASEKQLSAVRATAKELGRTTMFTAAQVGEAMLALKKLGLTVPQVIKAVPMSLELAAASGMDLAKAADLGLSTIRQFKLPLTDLSRVNNVLAKAQTMSGATIEQLGQSLKKVGVLAVAAGIDFETVVAAVGSMGDVAVRGGIGGTYMMNLLRMIQSPRKETETIFDYLLGGAGEFRKQIADAGTGGFIKLISIIEKTPVLEKRLLKLFNIRGGLGGLILSGAGTKRIREFTASLMEADAFAKIAAGKRLGGLPGAFLMLKSAIEAVTLAFFDSGLAGTIEAISIKITGVARSIAKANPKVLKLVGTLALVSLVVIGTLVVLALLISTLGVLFTPFGAWVGMVVALAAAIALGYTESEAFRGAMAGVWSIMVMLWEIVTILLTPFSDLYKAFQSLLGLNPEKGLSLWEIALWGVVGAVHYLVSVLAGLLNMLLAVWKVMKFDFSGAADSFGKGLHQINFQSTIDALSVAQGSELAAAPAPKQQQVGLSGSIDVRAMPGTEVVGAALGGTGDFDVGMSTLGYSGSW